jgi:dolichol-phosphate mannosyltransferase
MNPVLSIVIPALNEEDNLKQLLPRLHHLVAEVVDSYEVIIVDGGSEDGTVEVANACGAMAVQQKEPGYGAALSEGFARCQGEHIVTLDADLTHDPSYIKDLWEMRDTAEVVIASRHIAGGDSAGATSRHLLSVVLNRFLSFFLDIGVHDLSSGFRLYRADVVRDMPIYSQDFNSLVEIIVRAYAGGWHVLEVPFTYNPRVHGNTHAKIIPFGLGFLSTAGKMWKLRNSIECADYDARAYDSRIIFQRIWQRSRFRIITEYVPPSARVLDIGCGSSRILGALDEGIGLDIQLNKLRFARRYEAPLVNGDAFCLPFSPDSFDCIICSQVIEHLPAGNQPFSEMARVLRPGGRLILGTPDYGTVWWPIIEQLYHFAAPNAYADEHITHYTKASLVESLESYGFMPEAFKYVFRSELVGFFSLHN